MAITKAIFAARYNLQNKSIKPEPSQQDFDPMASRLSFRPFLPFHNPYLTNISVWSSFSSRYLSLRAWIVETYIHLLQYLGRAPEGMTEKLSSKLHTLQHMDAKTEITQRISLKLELSQRWKTRAENANEWFFHIMGGAYTLPENFCSKEWLYTR